MRVAIHPGIAGGIPSTQARILGPKTLLFGYSDALAEVERQDLPDDISIVGKLQGASGLKSDFRGSHNTYP